MLQISQEQHNLSYHPILDNYQQFAMLPKIISNDSNYRFGVTIEHAYRSCQKPCTEVTYTTSVDRFFLSSSEMRNCSEKGGKVMFQLSRHVDIEIEDYIIKGVDLVSGIGGAVG